MNPGRPLEQSVSTAVVVAFASLALLLLHALVPAPLPLHLRVFAAVPGVAALVLWWRFFEGRHVEKFPFVEYAVTQLYLYWGLPAVTMRAAVMPAVGERAWTGAVLGAWVVTGAVLVASPLGRSIGARAAGALQLCLPRTAPRLPAPILVPWLAVAAATHANVGAGIVPQSAYQLVTTLGGYAPLLAAIAWRDLREGRGFSFRLVACTVVLSLAGLLTGMMEAAVQPVLAAIVLHVVFLRRVPWRLIGAGALLVVLVNPAKHHYRELAWEIPETRAARDPLVAAERWRKAFEAAWASNERERAGNAASLLARLDELTIDAVAFAKTPAEIPFDEGKTWGYLATSLVPRFLYPDKPNFTNVYNDRFSVTFGFQTREATETSTGAFPLVADGYWNFGWPGVVVAGLITGGLFGFFAGAFRATSWALVAIATSTFAQLHATSCMPVQVMGVVQQVAGVAVVLWAAWIASAIYDRAAKRPHPGDLDRTAPPA